jgi:hypothetical protein
VHYLSKRLKKKIQDVCGLTDLPREEKLLRASEIITSTELKQAICNQVLGISFKNVERTMQAIIDDRRPSRHEEEMRELEEVAPYKLQKEDLFPSTKKYKQTKYGSYTKDEIARLLAASVAPVEYKEKEIARHEHQTYTLDQARALLEGRTDLKKR